MARGHPEALETSAALVTQGIVPVRPVFLTAVEAPLEPDGIRELVSDWRTHLRAKNRADSTIDAYLGSVAVLVNDLENEDISVVAPGIGRRELERYFEYLRQRPNSAPESRCRTAISPSSIGTCSSSGVGSTTWKRSLFCRMEVPHVPDNAPTVLREKELKALLATAKGKGLVELRDRAIILVLIDREVPGRRTVTVDRGESSGTGARELRFRRRPRSGEGASRARRTLQPGDRRGVPTLLPCLRAASVRQTHRRGERVPVVACRAHGFVGLGFRFADPVRRRREKANRKLARPGYSGCLSGATGMTGRTVVCQVRETQVSI